MRKTRIYLATELRVNSTAVLDKQASHHLIRVLRMKTGTAITVFNNSGHEYECTLLVASQTAASIQVNSYCECITESGLGIHLLQEV